MAIQDTIRKYLKRDPNEINKFGVTRLQSAILENDLSGVRAALAAGADVNFVGRYKEVPLHMALSRGRYAIVLSLIEKGADVNTKDANGQTALHVAMKRGQETFILALLKLNADPNAKDNNGNTPLHVAEPFYHFAVSDIVKHKGNVNAQNNKGQTPLHIFVDYPALVEKLIVAGADLNVVDKEGQTPFARMLDENYFPRYEAQLQKLILAKADIKTVNRNGENMLHLAARLQLENLFFTVISKELLAGKNMHGDNVIHVIAENKNKLLLEKAVERAPQLVKELNKEKLTPIEVLLRHITPVAAKQKNNWDEAALILLKAGANPDATDADHRSLLHHAVVHRRGDFIDQVMTFGANPNVVDATGRTPLHYAIERKDVAMMDILLDRGANPDMTDTRGWTILDRLAEGGDRDSSVVQRLIVAGGQYHKQLPLYPDLMRQPKGIDKGGLKPALDKPRF